MNAFGFPFPIVPREWMRTQVSGLIVSLLFTSFTPALTLVLGCLAYCTVAYLCYVFASAVLSLRLDEVVETEKPLEFKRTFAVLLLPPVFVLGLLAVLWHYAKSKE